jgi:hypothetical protein
VVVVAVVVAVEVDAEGDGHVRFLGGSGDDHLLGASREVLRGVVAGGEEAGRLDHHVDAEVAPGQRRRIALGEHLQRSAVDRDRVPVDADLAGEAADARVVLEQVGEGLRIGEVVDGDELQIGPSRMCRAKDVAANPPETVNADLHCH